MAAEVADDLRAVATLADAVQARVTTAERLLTALAKRPRVPRRTFLEAVLRDVAEGTCSVLEHGYLVRVERPHGVAARHPSARRQRPQRVYRDVEHVGEGVRIELDGRLFHDDARARDRDLERDLDSSVEERVTIGLGWGQVYGRACSTAVKIGAVLMSRGWEGPVMPCAACATTAVQYTGATG